MQYSPEQIAEIFCQLDTRVSALLSEESVNNTTNLAHLQDIHADNTQPIDEIKPGSLLRAEAELLALGFTPETVEVYHRVWEQALMKTGGLMINQYMQERGKAPNKIDVEHDLQSPLGIAYSQLDGVRVSEDFFRGTFYSQIIAVFQDTKIAQILDTDFDVTAAAETPYEDAFPQDPRVDLQTVETASNPGATRDPWNYDQGQAPDPVDPPHPADEPGQVNPHEDDANTYDPNGRMG